jgi:hypothetical protein
VLSKTFGEVFISEPHIAHTTTKTEPVQAIMQSTSYDELVERVFGGDSNKLFRFLLEYDPTKRLTIYCDADATFEIMTRFWKTLYPRMTDDTFYLLLNFTFSYFIEMLGNKYSIFAKIHQNQADMVRTGYGYYLADENKQQVLDRWNSTTPWTITRTQREEVIKNASVELQLASVMTNPKWRYASTIRTKVVKMIKKELIHEFSHDVRYGVLLNLPNFKVLEPTTTFNIFTDTLTDLIAHHPQYRFIVDDNFIPDHADYVFANYDMPTLNIIRLKIMAAAIDIDWSPLMKNNLTFDDIINFELSTDTNKLFLSRGDYHESVNPYMINYIFNSMRSNSTSALAEFELA